MADVLKHAFVSAKADGADATLVRPSNWNAAHAFAGGATGALLVRRSTEADGADWSTNFVGPYAIGGATLAEAQLSFRGTFTTGATNVSGFYLLSTLIPAANGAGFGAYLAPTLNKAGSGTHADFSTLQLDAPIIGAGAAVLTNASTLKITGAPTGATNNYALWVAAGNSRFDEKLIGKDGAASSPTYSFVNSPNSGFFHVGSGALGYSEVGTERFRLIGGILALGTTVTTSASAGHQVYTNGRGARFVNAAGTDTRDLITSVAGTDNISIGDSSVGAVGIGNPVISGASALDLVLRNSNMLRFANAAGTSTIAAISVNASNQTVLGASAHVVPAGAADTLALLAAAQTLTNKTVALGSNTVSGTLAQFNTAVTDADLASLAGVETLTNKTIALGSNTVSGTLAQFNAALTDGDFVSLAGTETLTNKTILAPSNTVAGVLDRDVVVAAVTNTITETAVYSFSVPAGTLGTNRALRLTLIGDYLNNTGVDRNFTVRVKYGGSTFFVLTASLIPASATGRSLSVFVTLSASNATNAQAAVGTMRIGAIGTATGTGDAVAFDMEAINSAGAVDSTLAQTLEVTFQHNNAGPTIDGRAHVVQLEVLR